MELVKFQKENKTCRICKNDIILKNFLCKRALMSSDEKLALTKSRQNNVSEHQCHSSHQHVSSYWEVPDPFPIAV